jgi:hypothetical protein
LLLAEGFTEEAFVKTVLAPHLEKFGVYLTPTVVNTKTFVTGGCKKGGGDFTKLDRHMRLLLRDTNAMVTMFYDYYAFPQNFPSNFALSTYADGLGEAGANDLEAALTNHFNTPRFKPYVHLHEFEAFMFVDEEITATILLNPSVADEIKAQRDECANAEAINDGVESAPSKRILKLVPRFEKLTQGIIITQQVGLPKLRTDCPRFSAWVTWLESLGDAGE